LIKNALLKVVIEKEISTLKSHLSRFNNRMISLAKNSSDIVKNEIIDEIQNLSDEFLVDNNEEMIQETQNITLGDISLISRVEDGHINATELCSRDGKSFSEWYQLDATKNLLKEAESRLLGSCKQEDGKLVDINEECY
jgi:hypothetical protein